MTSPDASLFADIAASAGVVRALLKFRRGELGSDELERLLKRLEVRMRGMDEHERINSDGTNVRTDAGAATRVG